MLLVVVSDPVGIRTRDPQLRRLLLYPAELPDLVGMRLSHERRLSASLGRPRFLLLHRTREVRCSLRPLTAMVLPCGKCSKISALSSAYARKNTHVGTQKGAYKGNLGAKVLLFFELCKYSCKILTKVLQNTFANQVYASHLRCDLPTHHS